MLAKTYRPSHLRGTSGMAPTPDLLTAMSGFRLVPFGITSGSDVPDAPGIREVMTLSGSARCLRRIPDRRGVGAVLYRHRCVRRHLDAKELGVICCPARLRDFDDPYIVKGALREIEVRVHPMRCQQRVADGVGVGRVGHIHRAANVALTTTLDDRPPVRAGYVIDAFLRGSIGMSTPE